MSVGLLAKGERLEGHSGVVPEQRTERAMCGLPAAGATALRVDGHSTGLRHVSSSIVIPSIAKDLGFPGSLDGFFAPPRPRDLPPVTSTSR